MDWQRKVGAVGSMSTLKTVAAMNACRELNILLTTRDCAVDSGVPEQPFGLEEMKRGATNRAERAAAMHPDADFSFGIESGLVHLGCRWFDVPYVVVLTRQNWKSIALGAYFPVPAWMVEQARAEKTEIGKIVQKLANGGPKDVQHYLSAGTVSREALLTSAVKNALMPIVLPHLYKD